MFEKRKERLERLAAKAAGMSFHGSNSCGVIEGNGQCWGARLPEDYKESLEMSEADRRENDLKIGKLCDRAHRGDLEAQHQLNGLVIQETQNFVAAETEWVRWFEVRTLADNESPAIRNLTKMEITAKYIGQDTGRPEATKVIRPTREVLVDLRELSTEEVEYRTRDIYTGDISEWARAAFDTGRDLAQQIEEILKPTTGGLLNTALGTFDVTNANKAARTLVTARRIRSGVLPANNTVQIANIGAGTKFGFHVFDEVIDYCVRFGDTDGTGALMPTGEVVVPADEIRQVVTGMAVTNSAQNDIAQQTLRRGWLDLGSYGGIPNWRLIPSRTLPVKYCYPRLNKPVGILWFKPSQDVMIDEVDRLKGLAKRAEMKVIGAAIPEPNKKNFLRVQYTT